MNAARNPLRSLVTIALLAAACTGNRGSSDESVTPTEPRSEPERQTLPLGRMIAEATVESLPPSSRPDDAPAPDAVPIAGPFKQISVDDDIVEYEAPIPARPRNLYFNKPRAMKLRFTGGESFLEFSRLPEAAHTWGFSATTIKVRRPRLDGDPVDGEYELVWPAASEREDALNRGTFPGEDREFVFRSVTTDISTRTGLLLPAPGAISWPAHLPSGAVLQFESSVLPPEIIGPAHSDGAALNVEIEVGGKKEVVERVPLAVGKWDSHRIDLSKWGGQHVTVRLRTDSAGTELLDYAFVAEPTIFVPSEHPERLLIVFVDTLRADHLGTYGYHRDTSPKLDAWAKKAVVFENARSVASWTLPAARSATTGRQPERYLQGPNVADALSTAGFATSFWGGNVYLSANFEMAAGWTLHQCENWPAAGEQIGKVKDWLAEQDGRDAAVLLHFMDAHLPYKEPRAYRGLWAPASPPAGLKERAVRGPILTAAKTHRDEVKEWVVGRYDQNIRYIDDQLGDLLAELGPDVKVVLFADHGEEFWEHDGFEHGHALYDEVVRVPLIVYSPEVPAGRVQAPVSLLDVTPTILDLVGVPAIDRAPEGISLLPAARGEAGAAEALRARPQAIGRTLYGDDRWGVLVGADKWLTHAGSDELYDLADDPGETRNLRPGRPDSSPWREAAGVSLRTEVPIVWRVRPSDLADPPAAVTTLTMTHPDGFTDAWLAGDPLEETAMELVNHDDGGVEVRFDAGVGEAREIFLQPKSASAAPTGLRLLVDVGDGGRFEGTVTSARTEAGTGETIYTLRAGPRTYAVTVAVSPVPTGDALIGVDDESLGALKALGYLED